MSIIISGLKLGLNQEDEKAFDIVTKKYDLKGAKCAIYKKSLDARRGSMSKVISVIVDCKDEKRLAEQNQNIKIKNKFERFVPSGTKQMSEKPIIIGFGPAGIMCAYELAINGYQPVVYELGQSIEERDLAIEKFIQEGIFNENSNIQFGEGGAGSYSDGKLTTRTSDSRCENIFNILHKFGAPDEIMYLAKPHIGTDILKNIVKNIRNEIIRLGGTINFNSKLTDLHIKNGKISEISINDQQIGAENVVLAIGHSARDTFELLHEKGVFIEPKSFAIGARVEHLQADVNESLYKKFNGHKSLPIGEYNLANTQDGRGCYTFCMCPGGIVVPANSQQDTIVTNGMSYHARNGKNANSAVVVSVNPSDFNKETPLAGMYFQKEIEQKAFLATNKSYKAPVQLVGDFLQDRNSNKFFKTKPTYQKGTEFCKLTEILPKNITDCMKTNLQLFSRKLSAFESTTAILTAPETRTSSPIRITRNEQFNSINTQGIIPCGEGAGYAGGIISACVDGLKCAEKIMEVYKAK